MTQQQGNVAVSKQEQIIEDAEIAINSITDTLCLLALEDLSQRLDIKKRLVDIMIEIENRSIDSEAVASTRMLDLDVYKDLRLSDALVEIIDEATKINRKYDEAAE